MVKEPLPFSAAGQAIETGSREQSPLHGEKLGILIGCPSGTAKEQSYGYPDPEGHGPRLPSRELICWRTSGESRGNHYHVL